MVAKKQGVEYVYTKEIADRICEAVATIPLRISKICKMYPDFPSDDTIRLWRFRHVEFAVAFSVAKRIQAEHFAESLEDVIANLDKEKFIDKNGVKRLDPGVLGQARLLVDTRKWTAAKLMPKVYGEVRQLEALERINGQLNAELHELRKKLEESSKSDH